MCICLFPSAVTGRGCVSLQQTLLLCSSEDGGGLLADGGRPVSVPVSVPVPLLFERREKRRTGGGIEVACLH